MDYMRPYKRLTYIYLVLAIIIAIAFWGTIITGLVIQSWTLLYIVPVIWVGGISVMIGMQIWLQVVKERCMEKHRMAQFEEPVVLTEEEKSAIDTIMKGYNFE